MRRTTVEGTDALGLGHTESGIKERCIVVVFQISETTFAVELLAHIITAIELAPVFQRRNSQLLDIIHRQVQVFPVMTVVGMTIILHLVGLVVRTARVVHHHDKRTVQLPTDSLFIERFRGVTLRLCQLFAVLILEGISELLHRLAQGETQHLVNLSQRFSLSLLNISSFLTLSHHLTQLETILTELRFDDSRHA